jgi:copper homeostasis protein CutC
MNIKLSPELLKLAKAIRQANAVHSILAKGELNDDDIAKLLKQLGLKDEHVDAIMEAKAKYDETGDSEPVIEAVAAAFGVPADELKKWVASIDIISAVLSLA